MKRIQLFVALVILSSMSLLAQNRIKKGPPDLSGTWVMKENGVTTRHYTATQNGNNVVMQCREYPERGLRFSWTEPGNYILSGTNTGVNFKQPFVNVGVREYYHSTTSGSISGVNVIYVQRTPDAMYNSVALSNFDDVLTCNLCQNNSFITEGKFEVSEKLDQIVVSVKNVRLNLPTPYFVEDKDHERVSKAVSGGDCCRLTYENNFSYAFTITKARDSW